MFESSQPNGITENEMQKLLREGNMKLCAGRDGQQCDFVFTDHSSALTWYNSISRVFPGSLINPEQDDPSIFHSSNDRFRQAHHFDEGFFKAPYFFRVSNKAVNGILKHYNIQRATIIPHPNPSAPVIKLLMGAFIPLILGGLAAALSIVALPALLPATSLAILPLQFVLPLLFLLPALVLFATAIFRPNQWKKWVTRSLIATLILAVGLVGLLGATFALADIALLFAPTTIASATAALYDYFSRCCACGDGVVCSLLAH